MERELHGFEIKKMKSDGACLFRAVADQVHGDQEMHKIVRENCMDYMVKNEEFFSKFIPEGFNEYIQRKRKITTYGDHVEIQALSEVYNRPIEVYQYSAEPINTFNGNYRNYTNDPPVRPVRLSYHGNIHYNSIIDQQIPNVGVGLGLTGYQTPAETENERIKKIDRTDVEEAIIEDKLKVSDWEAKVLHLKTISGAKFHYLKSYRAGDFIFVGGSLGRRKCKNILRAKSFFPTEEEVRAHDIDNYAFRIQSNSKLVEKLGMFQGKTLLCACPDVGHCHARRLVSLVGMKEPIIKKHPSFRDGITSRSSGENCARTFGNQWFEKNPTTFSLPFVSGEKPKVMASPTILSDDDCDDVRDVHVPLVFPQDITDCRGFQPVGTGCRRFTGGAHVVGISGKYVCTLNHRSVEDRFVLVVGNSQLRTLTTRKPVSCPREWQVMSIPGGKSSHCTAEIIDALDTGRLHGPSVGSIVLMPGTNELGKGPPALWARDLRVLLRTCDSRFPGVPILVVAPIPRLSGPFAPDVVHLVRTMDQVCIEYDSHRNRVRLVDFSDEFTTSRTELWAEGDNVHLSCNVGLPLLLRLVQKEMKKSPSSPRLPDFAVKELDAYFTGSFYPSRRKVAAVRDRMGVPAPYWTRPTVPWKETCSSPKKRRNLLDDMGFISRANGNKSFDDPGVLTATYRSSPNHQEIEVVPGECSVFLSGRWHRQYARHRRASNSISAPGKKESKKKKKKLPRSKSAKKTIDQGLYCKVCVGMTDEDKFFDHFSKTHCDEHFVSDHWSCSMIKESASRQESSCTSQESSCTSLPQSPLQHDLAHLLLIALWFLVPLGDDLPRDEQVLGVLSESRIYQDLPPQCNGDLDSCWVSMEPSSTRGSSSHGVQTLSDQNDLSEFELYVEGPQYEQLHLLPPQHQPNLSPPSHVPCIAHTYTDHAINIIIFLLSHYYPTRRISVPPAVVTDVLKMLLLLCGDIEENPGPIRKTKKCGKCKKKITAIDIWCRNCFQGQDDHDSPNLNAQDPEQIPSQEIDFNKEPGTKFPLFQISSSDESDIDVLPKMYCLNLNLMLNCQKVTELIKQIYLNMWISMLTRVHPLLACLTKEKLSPLQKQLICIMVVLKLRI